MTGRTSVPARWRLASWLGGPLFLFGTLIVGETLFCTPSGAQVLPPIFDPTGRSGEPPAPLRKEFKPPPVAPPSPLLPPAPTPPPEAEKVLPSVRVFVKDIRVIGSTVFSQEELAKVTAPFQNRSLATEDLERLRLALTLLYINRGYLTSGALIPDQDVKDGVITIQIVEGKLARITIEGNQWFRSGYLSDRIGLGATTPLQLGTLQERLQLLQQNPNLERVNAELRPGDTRGESVLNVRVTEANPWKGWLEFNNFQTPVVGAERGLATVAHQNVTGNNDPFSFTYGRSDGVNPIIDTFYSIPFTVYDTTLTGFYRRNDFLVVEAPFNPLQIKSDAEIIGLTLRQPIFRTLNQELAVAITGEHLFNKTFLLGQPFDFVAGSKNGVATVSALRFIQEWIARTQSTVLAARSRFSVGLDVLGATVNSGPVADGQFFSWLGQFQAVRRLDDYGGIQLLGRMDLQVANDRLFPLEQVPVGGRFSVRGYRENQLVRDNAFLFSVETRLPVLKSPQGEDILQLAPFIDVGRAWNAKGGTPDPDTLASVGLGIRWEMLPKNRAHFELYWGVPLNHVNTPGGNLQDHGIHLQLVVQAF